MFQPMQGAGAQLEKKEDNHWILTRDRMQDIITCLYTGRMTLKAAKLYYSAYDLEVKGRTKREFIKNLCELVEGKGI